MARMVDVDAIIKAMGIRTYMQTEWTPATAWGVPIVDAEPVRHGMWIKMSDAGQDIIFCSECGKELPRGVINSSNPQFDLSLKIKYMDKIAYCPNCGAKMDKGDDR